MKPSSPADSLLRSVRLAFSAPGGIREASVLAWPLVLSMASNAVMQFTDRVFLARYSDAAIEASLPAGVLCYLAIVFFQMTVGYSGTFVAQFHGAGRPASCVRAAVQGVWLTVASLPFFALCVPAGLAILSWVTADPAVLREERTYFIWMTSFGFLLPLLAAESGFFTGRGLTRLVMVATVLGSLLNILLDWLLIFGVGGFPRMGIAGAAIATVVSGALPVVILAVAALRDPLLAGGGWRLRVMLAPDFKLAGRILRFGVPAGTHVALDMATFTAFIFMTGRLDALSFAVSNVCFTINHLAFAPLLGLGMAASILVGQYQGAGKSRAAARAGWSAQLIAGAYVALFVLFLFFFGRQTLLLFRAADSAFPVETFLSTGYALLALIACWELFDSVNVVFGGALKGAGDTRFVMIVEVIVAVGVWMPAAGAVLAWHPDIVSLWLTYPLYASLLAVAMTVRWVRGAWRSIQVVEPENP